MGGTLRTAGSAPRAADVILAFGGSTTGDTINGRKSMLYYPWYIRLGDVYTVDRQGPGVDMEELQRRIVRWATNERAIRALILCGSRARSVRPADEWADLDLEMYVADARPFCEDAGWIEEFGAVWTHLQLKDDNADVFLILYEGARKVDFHIFSTDALERAVEAGRLHPAYVRGYEVLLDKDELAARLPPAPGEPPTHARPTPAEFSAQVSGFWYGAVYVAWQLRRRNLWVVKLRDWTMKEHLLRIIEWHTQAGNGWQVDTWNDGHFLTEWAAPEIVASLHEAFGRFDTADSWRALLATMELFARLARETATQLAVSYPFELERKVATTVQTLYEEDTLPA